MVNAGRVPAAEAEKAVQGEFINTKLAAGGWLRLTAAYNTVVNCELPKKTAVLLYRAVNC